MTPDDLLARLGRLRAPNSEAILLGQLGGKLVFEHGEVTFDDDTLDSDGEPVPECENSVTETIAGGRILVLAGRGALLDIAQRGDGLRTATAEVGAPVPPTMPPTPEAWISTAEAARRLGINRSTLDDMVKCAPRNLPGSPVAVGEGKKHRFLRWNPSHLNEWADAYRSAHKRSKTAR